MNRVFGGIFRSFNNSVVFIFCFLLFPLTAYSAQYSLDSLAIPVSQGSAVTIGSGLDVDLINQQRYTCLDFVPGDVEWFDGAGAVSTTANIQLVTDYKSLAKTLDLEVDYKSKADVSVLSLSAGAAVDLNVKYSDFAKDESRSLAIVLKAESDYGRKGLSNYKLKKEFSDLISQGDYAGYRGRCGTHTVVAERRKALVSVVIKISNVTSETKRSIEGLYRTSFSGSGSLDIAKLNAKVDAAAKWKNLIETASKVGDLSVSFESRGGAGIPDATKMLISNDPENLDNIIKALSGIGSSFTKEASSPTEYLLVSNSVFGAQIPAVDGKKLEYINSYFLRLAKIDYALGRISAYKNDYPELYSRFYSKPLAQLKGVRLNIVSYIEDCVLRDVCSYMPDKNLDLLFVEDVIRPDKLVLSCRYKRYSTPVDEAGNRVMQDILTNISVELDGKVRFSDYVSVGGAILSRFGPNDDSVTVIPEFPSLALSKTDESGESRIRAILDYKVVLPDVEVTSGTIVVRNRQDLDKVKNYFQESLYSVSMQSKKNNVSIINTLGPPFGGDCPVVRQVGR